MLQNARRFHVNAILSRSMKKRFHERPDTIERSSVKGYVFHSHNRTMVGWLKTFKRALYFCDLKSKCSELNKNLG